MPMPTLPSCWTRTSSEPLLAWMLTTGFAASVEVDLTTRVPLESPVPPMPTAPRALMEETSTVAPLRVSWPVMVSPPLRTLRDAAPVRPAVTVPAEKSPLGSRATMAPAVLALAAEWAPLPARAAWVKRAPLWTGLVEADTAEESTRAVWQVPAALMPRQRKPEPASAGSAARFVAVAALPAIPAEWAAAPALWS